MNERRKLEDVRLDYDFANYVKNDKKCYWVYNDNIIRNVTHWMPIPQLPKEE